MLLEEKCNTHEVVKILLDGGRFKFDLLSAARSVSLTRVDS